jgi:Short C-terminal domain
VAQQQEAQKQLDTYIRQTAGSGGGASAADELTKLARLHDEKKLSDEEFERAKAKIVG